MRVDFAAVFAAFARGGGPASRPIGRSPSNEQDGLDFRADLAAGALPHFGDRRRSRSGCTIQFAETIAASLPAPDAL
jgi:hypothetical protein